WASIPRAPGLPVVVFPHNAESQRARRQAEMRPGRLQRLNERTWARRLAAFESFALSRADQVITVSEDDARQLRPAAGRTPIDSVPTGVDLAEFPNVPLSEDQPPLVVF